MIIIIQIMIIMIIMTIIIVTIIMLLLLLLLLLIIIMIINIIIPKCGPESRSLESRGIFMGSQGIGVVRAQKLHAYGSGTFGGFRR